VQYEDNCLKISDSKTRKVAYPRLNFVTDVLVFETFPNVQTTTVWQKDTELNVPITSPMDL